MVYDVRIEECVFRRMNGSHLPARAIFYIVSSREQREEYGNRLKMHTYSFKV